MWNKDQNSSPSSATPGASPAPKASTADQPFTGGGALIGSTMRIKGDIFSKEEMIVNGDVEGKLEAVSRLTVGATGKAQASIKAGEVVIGGTVNGNVEATQRIVLRKGANLVGDVKTAGIVIEDGAFFRGGIDITRNDQQKPAVISA
jgi:cytoskeletal protein CcmA (bactofilin family)